MGSRSIPFSPPRRAFVQATSLVALSSVVGFQRAAFAQLNAPPTVLDAQRAGQRLRFDVRTHEGAKAASWLLRDIQANNLVAQPHPYLLQFAAWLQAQLAEHFRYTVFEVTSGLRALATNVDTEGASRASLHLPDASNQFYAMDFKPIGASIDEVARVLQLAQYGGVGIYSTHIHLDVRPGHALWNKRGG